MRVWLDASLKVHGSSANGFRAVMAPLSSATPSSHPRQTGGRLDSCARTEFSLRRRDRVVRLSLRIPGPRLPAVPFTAGGWCFRGYSVQSKSVPCPADASAWEATNGGMNSIQLDMLRKAHLADFRQPCAASTWILEPRQPLLEGLCLSPLVWLPGSLPYLSRRAKVRSGPLHGLVYAAPQRGLPQSSERQTRAKRMEGVMATANYRSGMCER